MRKAILRTLKGQQIMDSLWERSRLYEAISSRESIAQYQTSEFNRVWQRAINTNPFYAEWKRAHGLPRAVRHVEAISEFPLLTKRDILENSALVFEGLDKNLFYLTGGSTGEPAKFPKGPSEDKEMYIDVYAARSWLGIEPGDKFVHVWGHSHLLGSGLKGHLNAALRRSKDLIVGGYRISAYDKSLDATVAALDIVRRVKPKYIIGYSSSLVQMAQVAAGEGGLNIEELSWIVPTAETLSPQDKEVLSNGFRAKVAMEYGAREVGIVAQAHPKHDGLRTIWPNVYGNVDHHGRMRLTTLMDRAFPLINYEIGDVVEEVDNADHVLEIQGIAGRISDYVDVELADGSVDRYNVSIFVHTLQNVPGVQRVQVSQVDEGAVLVLATGVTSEDNAILRKKCMEALHKLGVSPSRRAIRVARVPQPLGTRAGKTPRKVPVELIPAVFLDYMGEEAGGVVDLPRTD